MLKAEDGNTVRISGTAAVTGEIRGTGNLVEISSKAPVCEVRVSINGDNNVVSMVDVGTTRGLVVQVGNHRTADRCSFTVGVGTSFEVGVQALLYQDGNAITLGQDCMLSNTIVFRGGEHPHLIFDMDTGAYLDVSDGIVIGNHVWIGEGAYITKHVTISSGSVVAARSVVTRRFDEENVVIGGNPARVVKRRVEWLRNHGSLKPGSRYEQAYRDTKARLARTSAEPEGFWARLRSR